MAMQRRGKSRQGELWVATNQIVQTPGQLRHKFFAVPTKHVRRQQSLILFICADQNGDEFSGCRDADGPP